MSADQKAFGQWLHSEAGLGQSRWLLCVSDGNDSGEGGEDCACCIIGTDDLDCPCPCHKRIAAIAKWWKSRPKEDEDE